LQPHILFVVLNGTRPHPRTLNYRRIYKRYSHTVIQSYLQKRRSARPITYICSQFNPIISSRPGQITEAHKHRRMRGARPARDKLPPAPAGAGLPRQSHKAKNTGGWESKLERPGLAWAGPARKMAQPSAPGPFIFGQLSRNATPRLQPLSTGRGGGVAFKEIRQK
jgi:hypothetical protein